MWWWAEVSVGGTRSSGTVIFAVRARHSARRPHRTGASACRTRAVTLLQQPDIVGDLSANVSKRLSLAVSSAGCGRCAQSRPICAGISVLPVKTRAARMWTLCADVRPVANPRLNMKAWT
jgi:hypothetical protein